MFTGLIEETGRVVKREARRNTVMFSIRGRKTARSLKAGESIAVDGVCLTALHRRGNMFTVQAVEETLGKTNLGSIREGSLVNLERPLAAGGRLGGHFVLGHVDATGIVKNIETKKGSWVFHIGIASRFRKFLIPVGSVAVNGVSLTVARLSQDSFSVSIIPHTWKMTTFRSLKRGDRVNIEFDVLGKYALNVGRGRRS
ncbi:MAG TPA: riboflavin synthase [Bacteroidota bacterium]